MVTGLVLRRHAGGYLVYASKDSATLQCSLRARLKKEGVSIFTGDEVELDEMELFEPERDRGTAVIVARRERRNLLSKPYIANVDQVLIVQAVRQPQFNHLLCDRYLVHLQLELPAARYFVCINKCDLAESGELEALRNIYEPLDYKVLLVSAKTGQGLDELKQALAGATSVLTGPSGVGKSSLINRLCPGLNLKVDVREELVVGRHTTTYSELYRLEGVDSDGASGWIADTPGFSLGELRHPEPQEVAWQFPDIARFAHDCKYADCLHMVEDGCHVCANLDEIAPERYESFRVIIGESQEEKRQQQQTSQKVETGVVKLVGGRHGARAIPKLSSRHRATSRRREKQRLSHLESHLDETDEPVGDVADTTAADRSDSDEHSSTDISAVGDVADTTAADRSDSDEHSSTDISADGDVADTTAADRSDSDEHSSTDISADGDVADTTAADRSDSDEHSSTDISADGDVADTTAVDRSDSDEHSSHDRTGGDPPTKL